jgi:hypothetical protein
VKRALLPLGNKMGGLIFKVLVALARV